MNLEGLIAASRRAQQADDAGLGNCSRIWHAGFFFDGIHRNVDQDAPENRLSNIARLFRAFPTVQQNTASTNYDAFYFSGLGTPFKESLAESIHTMMDGAQNSIIDDLTGQPAEMIKDVGIEVIKGSDWWEVLKDSGKKLLSPSEWRKLANDVAKNAVKKSFIEATPWLRDNSVIADMLVTGADTRLNSARMRFDSYFKEASSASPVPIKLISVSVFGFGLGATLARQFLDILLDEVCYKQGDKYLYRGIPVDIVFTGLFDCARHTPASNSNGVDVFASTLGGPLGLVSPLLGDKSLDHQTSLPSAVRSALHLVAAHETRVWRTVYRLGASTAKHQEELLPGSAEDIGGGLKPDEQKPSAELCRIALHRMYRAATMAGVPFPDIQSLDKIDTEAAAYFVMSDSVKGKSVNYWSSLYQQAVPYNKLSMGAQNHHLDSYIEWLSQQYYLYRSECIKYENQHNDAVASAAVSAGASAGMLGITPDALKVAKGYQNEIAVLKKHWGWLDDVHRTAVGMRNSMESNPDDKRRHILPEVYGPALRRVKRFLSYAHAAYQGKPQPMPFDRAPGEMYAWFIHDVQTVEPSGEISEDFFCIRAMEMPESDS